MSNMNGRKRNLFSVDKRTTTNHEGHTVHQLDPVEILFNKVMGSFFGESTYYEDHDAMSAFQEVLDLVHSLSEEDKEYALKVALLGRENNMIQYPLAVLTACFNDDKYKGERCKDTMGRSLLSVYADRIVKRGKDVVDVMTYQMKGVGCNPSHNGRDIPLPMQLRKSMKSSLETLSDYTLSKGLCEGHEVSLADCIKMLHPNPNIHNARGGRKSFYKEVIEGNVKFAEGTTQVQTELVKFGQSKEVDMSELADTVKKSTVMALLKNLVALFRVGAFDSKIVSNAIHTRLTDPDAIRKSRLLPFRFYSAYIAVRDNTTRTKYTNDILDSIEVAMDLSCDNMTDIDGYNAILLDRSGSMREPLSSRSEMTADLIGCMLAAIVMKRTKGDVYVFADRCVQVEHMNAQKMSLLRLMEHISKNHVGGGTYVDLALRTIEQSGIKYDNLIVLTDGDIYTQYGNSFNIVSYNSRTGGRSSCDDFVNEQMKRGVYRRLFLNNLLGNSFSAVNVDDYRKNLVVSFTDKFVDMINLYCELSRKGGNVREIIDRMVEELPNK